MAHELEMVNGKAQMFSIIGEPIVFKKFFGQKLTHFPCLDESCPMCKAGIPKKKLVQVREMGVNGPTGKSYSMLMDEDILRKISIT